MFGSFQIDKHCQSGGPRKANINIIELEREIEEESYH